MDAKELYHAILEDAAQLDCTEYYVEVNVPQFKMLFEQLNYFQTLYCLGGITLRVEPFKAVEVDPDFIYEVHPLDSEYAQQQLKVQEEAKIKYCKN